MLFEHNEVKKKGYEGIWL